MTKLFEMFSNIYNTYNSSKQNKNICDFFYYLFGFLNTPSQCMQKIFSMENFFSNIYFMTSLTIIHNYNYNYNYKKKKNYNYNYNYKTED